MANARRGPRQSPPGWLKVAKTGARNTASAWAPNAPAQLLSECAAQVINQCGRRVRQCIASPIRTSGKCAPSAPQRAASCGSPAIDTRIPRSAAILRSACASAPRRVVSRVRNTTRLPRGSSRATERGSGNLSSSVIKTSAGSACGTFARALRRAASLASLPITKSCLLQTHRTVPPTRLPPLSRASMRQGRPRLRPHPRRG